MNNEGKRYDFIREKVGLSKKDFAESLGLSMSMGSQISSGLVKPSRSLLDRLADAYNVQSALVSYRKRPLRSRPGHCRNRIIRPGSRRWPRCGSTGLPRKAPFPDTSFPHSLPPPGSPSGGLCYRGQHDRSPHLRWGYSHLPPRADNGQRHFCSFHREFPGGKAGRPGHCKPDHHLDKCQPRIRTPPLFRPGIRRNQGSRAGSGVLS